MSKKILFLIVLGVLVLPVIALASADTIGGLFETIAIGIIWAVFGCIAVISFVASAIIFLTAMGSPEKIKQARSAFLWGVFGVVVGIVAYSIVTILSNILLN